MVTTRILGVLLAAGFSGYAADLDSGYRQLYNLEFDGAHKTFAQWQTEHPADPMGPVSDAAAYLFAEFDRLRILQSEFFAEDNAFLSRQKSLMPDAGAKRSFEAALERASQLIKRSSEPADVNTDLAAVLRSGLFADYLALIEKRNMAALTEIKQSRTRAEALLERHPDCYDAHLAVGVENYMLSLKPVPIQWFLRLGGARPDRQGGIERLKITAEKGRLLMPYARLLLAVAAVRDKDQATARTLLGWLAREFPNNRLYREELGKLK